MQSSADQAVVKLGTETGDWGPGFDANQLLTHGFAEIKGRFSKRVVLT